MRGIGKGQTIHLYIIPEIERLMARELKHARMPPNGTSRKGLLCFPPPAAPASKLFFTSATGIDGDQRVLVDVAAWLVINSMRSERIQFNQLCIQNVSNVWRKNAFKTLLKNHTEYERSLPQCPNAIISAGDN